MNYKEELKISMDAISKFDDVIHIGYGLITQGRAAGSLKSVSNDKIIETPVAENLMLGLAIGMSLCGFTPVVYYERFDFIMNAMDALVNHLDKIKKISKGEFDPKVIIRCVIGGKKNPFFTGVTHTQDFTEALKLLLSFDVLKITNIKDINSLFINAYNSNKSIMIIEEKDRYAENI